MLKRYSIFIISVFVLAASLGYAAAEINRPSSQGLFPKDGTDICPVIKENIKSGYDVQKLVKTGVEMGYNACFVIKCAVSGGANLVDIVKGAVEASVHTNVISRCAIEAGANAKEVAQTIAEVGTPILCYIEPDNFKPEPPCSNCNSVSPYSFRTYGKRVSTANSYGTLGKRAKK